MPSSRSASSSNNFTRFFVSSQSSSLSSRPDHLSHPITLRPLDVRSLQINTYYIETLSPTSLEASTDGGGFFAAEQCGERPRLQFAEPRGVDREKLEERDLEGGRIKVDVRFPESGSGEAREKGRVEMIGGCSTS
jgi:hypothetical protein